MKLAISPIAVCVALATGQALAKPESPLAERVPTNALLYVGWAGAESIVEQYEGTHTQALLEQSEMPAVFSEYVPELLAALGREERDAQPVIDFVNNVGPILWQKPHALAFGGIDWQSPLNDGDPMPRIMVVVDAGDQAAELRAGITQSLASWEALQLVPLIREQDGFVYMSVGYGDMDLAELAAEGAGGMPDNDRFDLAMNNLPGGFEQGTLLSAYVDVPGMAALVVEAIELEGDVEDAQQVLEVMDVLGLDTVGDLSYAIGFDGDMFVASAFFGLPGERDGLFRLLPAVGDGLDSETIDQIPADSTMVAATRFEVGQLIPVIRDVVNRLSPENAENIDQGLQFANMFGGADLEQDVLGNVGPTWGFFVSPSVGNDLIGGVVVNRPADADKLTAALRGLSLNLTSVANGQLRQETDGMVRIPARTVERDGETFYLLNAPVLAPTWSIADGTLTLGLLPQSAIAARQVKGGFTSGDAAAKVMELTDGNVPISMTYAALPTMVPDTYPAFLALTQAAFGAGDLLGDFLRTTPPTMVLPPLPTVMEHVTPSMSASWQTDAGIMVRSVEPFPASGLLIDSGNVGGLLNSIGTVAPLLSGNGVHSRPMEFEEFEFEDMQDAEDADGARLEVGE